MDAEALRNRTKEFAARVMRTVDSLSKTTSIDVVGKQLVRSATSVAANYRAACRARSRAEFIAKMHIVQEEADESQYWLDCLRQLNPTSPANLVDLHKEASELTAIFTASIATLRGPKKNN